MDAPSGKIVGLIIAILAFLTGLTYLFIDFHGRQAASAGATPAATRQLRENGQTPVVASTSPSAVTSEGPGTCVSRSIAPGGTQYVEAGCTVSGDVQLSSSSSGPFQVFYDQDQTTGLVVEMDKPGYVRAPYGASITGLSPAEAAASMKASGCGLPSGCRSVKLIRWTG